MKKITLLLILCISYFNFAQDNTLVVKINYSCLDFNFIDDKTTFSINLKDGLNERGLNELSSLEEVLPGIGEYKINKVFPFLTTKDTVSTSRLGDKITIPPFWSAFRLEIPEDLNIRRTIYTLNRATSFIDYAHFDYSVDFQSAPDDTFYVSLRQESLNDPFNLADINIEDAWGIETGEPFVTVGVHDTGIDSLHPDLRVSHGNGYYYEDPVTLPVWGSDEEGHGTPVAGIIGAKRNNQIGIAGIAGGNGSDTSGCTLVDLKWPFIQASVSPQTGVSHLLAGIVDGARAVGNSWDYPQNYVENDYNSDAYYLNAPGMGLNIGNHSYIMRTDIPTQIGDTLGGKDIIDNPGENTISITNCALCREAYLFSLRNGVINVVARGNSASLPGTITDPLTVDPFYPQSFPDNWIVMVGASGYDGSTVEEGVNQSPIEAITNFWSLYGSGMDLIAPGSDSIVYSTKSTSTTPLNTDYKPFNGTSAAAPHVTGVIALLLSHYNKECYTRRNLSIEDVEYILEKSATNLSGTMFYDDLTGWGRLNAYEALKMIENETKQIVHPDSLIAVNVIARDTIALGYNKAFVGDGWGPISRAIPLTREAEYEVERVLIENTYYFGDYITPATQIIDYWERPSASNSIVFYRDTIQQLTALPPAGTPATQYIFDYFNLTPFDSITSIDLVNNELKIQGYYYHFIKQYEDVFNTGIFTGLPVAGGLLQVDTTIVIDEWHPVNPFENAQMAFSIYIEDSTLTSIYDHPCDSAYLSFVDSVEHTFNLASLNVEESNLIEVYPNPVNNTLSIRFSDFGSHHIILYNALGELLNEWDFVGNKAIIDMESYAKGVYILNYSNEAEMTTTKIVKR